MGRGLLRPTRGSAAQPGSMGEAAGRRRRGSPWAGLEGLEAGSWWAGLGDQGSLGSPQGIPRTLTEDAGSHS